MNSTYTKFNKFFEQKPLKKKNSSVFHTNYSYLPLLKIERSTSNKSLGNTIIQMNNNTINNSKIMDSNQIYQEIQEKKSRYFSSIEKLSLKNLCNLQKSMTVMKTDENEKKLKKHDYLQKIVYTNEKPNFQVKRNLVFREIPARFTNKSLKSLDYKKNSDFLKKPAISTFSKPIKAFEVNTNESIQRAVIPSFSEGKMNEMEVKNVEMMRNIVDFINIIEIEQNQKQYLEIAADYKFKKHTNFQSIRKALVQSLNMIFELKLDLKDIREKKIFSTKPFQKPGSYEFINAVKFGKINEVREMLKKNRYLVYDYDYVYYTGLHWACKRGHFEIAFILCYYGANTNAHDIIGRPPLFFSLSKGYHRISQVLLYYKADPWSNKAMNVEQIINKDTVLKKIIQKSRKLHIVIKMTPVGKRRDLWEQERYGILLESPFSDEIVKTFEKINFGRNSLI